MPSIGTPSTIYKGSLPAVIEDVPLMRMENPACGWPEERTTCTPAALPSME